MVGRMMEIKRTMNTFYLLEGPRDPAINGQGYWWEQRYFIDSVVHKNCILHQTIVARDWKEARRIAG
jgi:hypothetical protein